MPASILSKRDSYYGNVKSRGLCTPRLWVKAGPARPARPKREKPAQPGDLSLPLSHAPIYAPAGIAATDGQDIPGLKNKTVIKLLQSMNLC